MPIDWTAFTPGTSAAGGALIGLAAAVLVVLNGRVAGISGILGALLRQPRGDTAWRAAFIAGLIVAPVVWSMVGPLPAVNVDTGWGGIAVAGLLVGIGTRYGSGCTSGHGVCGLARLSRRSAVATVVFIGAAVVTVWVLRHLMNA